MVGQPPHYRQPPDSRVANTVQQQSDARLIAARIDPGADGLPRRPSVAARLPDRPNRPAAAAQPTAPSVGACIALWRRPYQEAKERQNRSCKAGSIARAAVFGVEASMERRGRSADFPFDSLICRLLSLYGVRIGLGEINHCPMVGAYGDGASLIDNAAALLPAGADLVMVETSHGHRRRR